jgi:two-component system sensor histidine kinase/response regulator
MKKNKILLVDDEINLRETISELLIHENYIVKTASDGQEALNILDSWIPDLIISDIMMPIMDGNRFHQLIKDNIELSSIPFIFMTAMNGENQMRKYLTNGADDFITKPFKLDELIEIVKNKIERFNKIKNAYSNIYTGNKTSFLHEINTPLNGILAPIDLLIENEDLEKEDVLKFYEAIKISGVRLNRTMQNIMFYQNVKSNILKFEDNSYAAIFDNFLKVKNKIFEVYEYQEKRITYAIDKADLKISQKNLSFILFELIDNALKFSSHNKIVVVSGSIYNQEFYELVIKDFGIGFSENELTRIGATQQFNREKQEQQGLGLGLFLSRIIVKKIKGAFSISSKEKKGTTIKILLPLKI